MQNLPLPAATPDAIARARPLLFDPPWLQLLPADFRAALFEAAQWRAVPAGQLLGRVDDPPDGIFGIGEGAVAIATALAPPDAMVAHIFNPGDWFGIDILFTRRPRTATFETRLPSLLAFVPVSALEALGAAFPEGWRHAGLLAVRGTQTATNIAADLMIADSRRRCLAALLRQAGARFVTPARRPLLAPLSQAELAAITALSRNTVSMILRRAEAAGQVALRYGVIELRDADALRWIVNEGDAAG